MEYQSSSESEEEPKELNKKLCRKLANRIVPIKNSDKKYAEGWTPSRAKDIGNFPNPSRILLLGPCNVGKSTLLKTSSSTNVPNFRKFMSFMKMPNSQKSMMI
jgi:ATPase subunit of ABC transporter with duplicated ATPase domains